MFTLCLWEANNGAGASLDFVTNRITLGHSIDATNIPTKDVPRAIIHQKQMGKKVHDLLCLAKAGGEGPHKVQE